MIARSSSKKNFPKFLILAGFLALLVFLNHRGILNPFKELLQTVFTRGSQSTRSGLIDTRHSFAALFSLDEIRAELEKTQELDNKVKSLGQEKEELGKENAQLREQLNLLPRQEFQLTGAEVMAQDPDSSEEFILINRGSEAGIQKDQTVIISDRILVGQVWEVEPRRAKVLLSVSPQSAINAVVAKEQVAGVAKGKYNLEMKLELIPNQTPLNKGDLIITSGRNQKYPPGLLVGEVVSASPSPDGLFREAVVKPFYATSDLKFVFVVTGNK